MATSDVMFIKFVKIPLVETLIGLGTPVSWHLGDEAKLPLQSWRQSNCNLGPWR
jgi:hypothetical protein